MGAPSHGGSEYRIPDKMKAWVLGGPDELSLVDKPVPQPGMAEVLVRIDAIAVCATTIIHTHSFPLAEVPTAIRYASERIDDAIKVVVQIREA